VRSSALADDTSPSSPILISTIPWFPFLPQLEAGEKAGGEKQQDVPTGTTITLELHSARQGWAKTPLAIS